MAFTPRVRLALGDLAGLLDNDALLDAGRDWLRTAGAVAAPGTVLNRQTQRAALRTAGRVRTAANKAIYQPVVDPTRALVRREWEAIQDDPRRGLELALTPNLAGSLLRGGAPTQRALMGDNDRTLLQAWGDLGEEWRADDKDATHRVIENLVDPINLIPFGKGKLGAKVARGGIEALAGAGGQVALGALGEKVGGERGRQVGEMAGLVAGGLSTDAVDAGKRLMRNPRVAEVIAKAGLKAEEMVDAGPRAMFHGAGRAYDTPDPLHWDPEGLYGPGYYLTENPKIASAYAEDALARGLGDAPNVRKVNVPRDLNLFQIERPVDDATLAQVRAVIATLPQRARTEWYGDLPDPGPGVNPRSFDFAVRQFEEWIAKAKAKAKGGKLTGQGLYNALTEAASAHRLDSGQFGTLGDGAQLRQVNAWLANAGFDGIAHDGGKRSPIRTRFGLPVRHDVAIVFEHALPKVQNALSLTPMGAGVPLKGWQVRMGLGGAAGSAITAEEDEDASLGEIIAGGIAGAAIGAAGLPLGKAAWRGGKATAELIVDPSRRIKGVARQMRRDFLTTRDELRGVGEAAAREIRDDIDPVLERARISAQGEQELMAALIAERTRMAAIYQNLMSPTSPTGRVRSGAVQAAYRATAQRMVLPQLQGFNQRIPEIRKLFGLDGGIDGTGRAFAGVLVENPQWYADGATPLLDQATNTYHPALQRLRDISDEALDREIKSGAWDRNIREWQKQIRQKQQALAKLDTRMNRLGDQIADAYRTAPMERQAGMVGREAGMGHFRAAGAVDDADSLRAGIASAPPTPRGANVAMKHGRQFHALGRDLDRRVDVMEGIATRRRRAEVNALVRKATSVATSQQKLRDEITALQGKITRPVANYIPHLYASGTTGPMPFGGLQVGARQFFQNERTLPTYLTAAMKGEMPAKSDKGEFYKAFDLFDLRLRKSANAVSDMEIVRGMRDDLAKANGEVVPDYWLAEQPDDIKKQYRALPNVRLNLADTGDVQQQLLDQLTRRLAAVGSSNAYVKGISDANRGRIGAGQIKFYVKKSSWGRALGSLDTHNILDDHDLTAIVQKSWNTIRTLIYSGFPDQAIKQAIWSWFALGGPLRPISSTSVLLRAWKRARTAQSFERFKGERGGAWDLFAGAARQLDPGLSDLRGFSREDDLLQKWAKANNPAGKILNRTFAANERWVFDRWGPALVVGTIEELAARRAAKGLTLTPADKIRLADAVRKTLVGVSREDVAIGASHEAVQRLLLNSPNFMRRDVYRVIALGRGGLEGELARRAVAGMLATGLIAAGTITYALNQDKDPMLYLAPIRDGKVNRDAIYLPGGRNFMAIVDGDGTRYNLFAEATSLLGLVLSPVGAGVRAAETGVREDDDPLQLMTRVADAVQTTMRSSGERFVTNRLAPVPALIGEVRMNQSRFPNAPIWGPDDSTPEQLLKIGRHTAASLMPAPLQDPLKRATGANPEPYPGHLTEGWSAAGNMLGFRVKPEEEIPAEVRAALVPYLRNRGIEPGWDPVDAYQAAGLDSDEIAAFERDHPEVRDFINQRVKKRVDAQGQFSTREKNDQFRHGRNMANEAYRRKLEELDAAGIEGDDWRARRGEAVRARIEAIEQAARDAYGTSDPERIAAAVADAYGDEDDPPAVRAALRDLAQMEPSDPSTAATRAFFQEREAYLAGLPADTRDRLLAREEALAVTKRERQYILDKRQMSAYYAIPRFRRMSAAEGDLAERLSQQARTLQRYYYPRLDVEDVIRRKMGLNGRQRRIALAALRGKGRNPQRARYLSQHPHLSQFYSNLTLEESGLLLGEVIG